MLSSAILFVPARRLTGPVKVNSLFSLVPNADPVIVTGKALINQIMKFILVTTMKVILKSIPENCPLMKT
jgi:hypothetical protein